MSEDAAKEVKAFIKKLQKSVDDLQRNAALLSNLLDGINREDDGKLFVDGINDHTAAIRSLIAQVFEQEGGAETKKAAAPKSRKGKDDPAIDEIVKLVRSLREDLGFEERSESQAAVAEADVVLQGEGSVPEADVAPVLPDSSATAEDEETQQKPAPTSPDEIIVELPDDMADAKSVEPQEQPLSDSDSEAIVVASDLKDEPVVKALEAEESGAETPTLSDAQSDETLPPPPFEIALDQDATNAGASQPETDLENQIETPTVEPSDGSAEEQKVEEPETGVPVDAGTDSENISGAATDPGNISLDIPPATDDFDLVPKTRQQSEPEPDAVSEQNAASDGTEQADVVPKPVSASEVPLPEAVAPKQDSSVITPEQKSRAAKICRKFRTLDKKQIEKLAKQLGICLIDQDDDGYLRAWLTTNEAPPTPEVRYARDVKAVAEKIRRLHREASPSDGGVLNKITDVAADFGKKFGPLRLRLLLDELDIPTSERSIAKLVDEVRRFYDVILLGQFKQNSIARD